VPAPTVAVKSKAPPKEKAKAKRWRRRCAQFEIRGCPDLGNRLSRFLPSIRLGSSTWRTDGRMRAGHAR